MDLLDQSFHRYVEVLIDFTFPYHDKADAIGAFMFRLREMDQPLEHFDERLWMEQLTGSPFFKDGGMLFKFQNGSELAVQNNCIGVNK